MTYIEQAIKEASDNGYKLKMLSYERYQIYPYGILLFKKKKDLQGDLWVFDTIFLDPLFWQALGKARGWEQGDFEICFGCGVRIKPTTPDRKSGKHYACHSDIIWYPSEWRFQSELFFKRLMESKNAESFFAQLK